MKLPTKIINSPSISQSLSWKLSVINIRDRRSRMFIIALISAEALISAINFVHQYGEYNSIGRKCLAWQLFFIQGYVHEN